MPWCSTYTPEDYLERGKINNDLNEAIKDFTKAIERKSAEWCVSSEEKEDFLCECYFNLGMVYRQQNNYNQAIKNYIKIIKINGWEENYYKNDSTLFKEIGLTLDKVTDFTGMDKDDVFNAIKALAASKITRYGYVDNGINLLKQCLVPGTPLSNLMWKQRWFTPCHIENKYGTLKKIVDLLGKLDPDYNLPDIAKGNDAHRFFSTSALGSPRLFSQNQNKPEYRTPIQHLADYHFRR